MVFLRGIAAWFWIIDTLYCLHCMAFLDEENSIGVLGVSLSERKELYRDIDILEVAGLVCMYIACNGLIICPYLFFHCTLFLYGNRDGIVSLAIALLNEHPVAVLDACARRSSLPNITFRYASLRILLLASYPNIQFLERLAPNSTIDFLSSHYFPHVNEKPQCEEAPSRIYRFHPAQSAIRPILPGIENAINHAQWQMTGEAKLRSSWQISVWMQAQKARVRGFNRLKHLFLSLVERTDPRRHKVTY